MQNEAPLIRKIEFPDPLVSDKEKNSKEYILNWAHAITNEWFSRKEGQGDCKFITQKDNFHTRMLYARGEHPTDYINQSLNNDEKEAYTNFDARPIQVLPNFVNIMVNSAYDRLFKIRAEATDKFSTAVRDDYQKVLEDFMVSTSMLKEAKDLHGIDLMPGEELPQNQDEIEVHMRSKFKPGIERATEKLIRYVLTINDYEEDVKEILRDLIVYGVAGAYHETDLSKGIVTDRLPVDDMVWSFPERRNFDNVYYYGHLKRMTITEALRISNLSLEEEDLKNLAATQQRWSGHMGYSNARSDREEDLDHMMVDVLFFNFKAYNTITYKKRYKAGNRISMIRKDDTFSKPDPSYSGYDAVKKVYDVWYKGAIILGTEHLFNYGLCENLVRPEGVLNRTLPQHLMYAVEIYQGRFRSPVGSVLQYIDQMQQVHVKILQMIAKARPSGVAVDVHGLGEVIMGEGGETLTPLELQKIHDQTGNIYYSSLDEDGSVNYNREPIRELVGGIIRELPNLINSYNHLLEIVRQTLGVPQGVDATLPDERTLVGVQKLTSASANTANRHILDGCLNITQRLGTAIGLRMKDIFKYSHLKEAYINAIGKIDMKLLESIQDYHLHDLSIIISLMPDNEERAELMRLLEIAQERQEIGGDSILEIKDIAKTDVKLAGDVYKIRKARFDKQKREEQLEQIKVNADENAKAAERASAAKVQEVTASETEKRKTKELEGEIKAKIIGVEEAAKMRLMEKEAELQMIVQGTLVTAKGRFDMGKEKLKGENAAKKEGSNFESANDQINNNMGLGAFEPS